MTPRQMRIYLERSIESQSNGRVRFDRKTKQRLIRCNSPDEAMALLASMNK